VVIVAIAGAQVWFAAIARSAYANGASPDLVAMPAERSFR